MSAGSEGWPEQERGSAKAWLPHDKLKRKTLSFSREFKYECDILNAATDSFTLLE